MASVKLVDISKHFGSAIGVARQSLDVEDGEFMVFLGPSGCGKTTTMRMIAGLVEPTEGSILIDDEDVTDAPPKDRDVAMVFQNYGLYPHMTVGDNIGYPLKIRGLSKDERRVKIEEVADKVELGKLLDRRPSALSGGQRQRVALARAIVRRPKVFLMDEPLSNLDAKLRVTMRAEIKHLQRELGITTIYVTHDQIEALTLADRIAVMYQGAIQQLGTAKEIYDTPANLFVAGFIGSPPMNLIKGSFENGTFRSGDLEVALPFASAGSMPDAVLGVRPENITVVEGGSGHVNGPVYTFEMTGEAVLVTIDVGEDRICARGDRELESDIGEHLSFRFDPSHCHLFDGESGLRLERDARASKPVVDRESALA